MIRYPHSDGLCAIGVLLSVFTGLCITAICAGDAGAISLTHDGKSRIQVSGEMDNNIGEDSYNPISGRAVRFFSTTRGAGTITGSTPYGYDVVVGYRAYQQYHAENRLVVRAHSDLEQSVLDAFYVGVDGSLYLEDYRENGRDNNSILGSAFIRLPQQMVRLFEMNFRFQAAQTRYVHDPFFDFTDNWWSVTLRKSVNRRFSLWGGYSHHPRIFKRQALKLEDGYSVISGMSVTEVSAIIKAAKYQQRDLIHEYSFGWQYYRRVLIGAWLLFRNTNSNSYGFSNKENRIGLIFGSPFIFGSMLKMYMTFEAKSYEDRLSLPIVTDIDEDKEEDNRMVAEISRDIIPGLALEIRYEWLRNESRIRNLYYSKHIFSSGLEYAF